MRIREEKSLKDIAERLGKSFEELQDVILHSVFLDMDCVSYENDTQFFGSMFSEFVDDEDDFRYRIEKTLGKITDEDFDNILNSVCMGNGDCPICGGTMLLQEHDDKFDFETGEWKEGTYRDWICDCCGCVR